MSTQMPNFETTLGAFEVGTLFNTVLLGAAQIQIYYYFSQFPKDHFFLKTLVAVVWALDMAKSWTIFISLYDYTIINYGNPTSIGHAPSILWIGIVLGGASTALVQSFLAFRVYRFMRVLPIALLSWTLTVVRFIGCLSISITGYKSQSLAEYKAHLGWIYVVVLIISMVNDFLITGGLCFTLYKTRDKCHSRTNAAIDKLIIWSIETGAITIFTTLLVVVTYYALPGTYVWIGFYLVSGLVCSNSFLALLNGRASLRDQMGTGTISGPMGNGTGNHWSHFGFKMSTIQETDVEINVTNSIDTSDPKA